MLTLSWENHQLLGPGALDKLLHRLWAPPNARAAHSAELKQLPLQHHATSNGAWSTKSCLSNLKIIDGNNYD